MKYIILSLLSCIGLTLYGGDAEVFSTVKSNQPTYSKIAALDTYFQTHHETKDACDALGRNLLHHAAMQGDETLVAFCQSHSIDCRIRDAAGYTPLMYAINPQHGVPGLFEEMTAVGKLADQAHLPTIIRLCDDKRYDLTQRTLDGETLVHIAISSGNQDVLRYVCSKCSENNQDYIINQEDNAGMSPLSFLLAGNRPVDQTMVLMETLLGFGANPNAASVLPLAIACRKHNGILVASLLQAGALPNIKVASTLISGFMVSLMEHLMYDHHASQAIKHVQEAIKLLLTFNVSLPAKFLQHSFPEKLYRDPILQAVIKGDEGRIMRSLAQNLMVDGQPESSNFWDDELDRALEEQPEPKIPLGIINHALLLAVGRCQEPMTDLLLRAGAMPRACNAYGISPESVVRTMLSPLRSDLSYEQRQIYTRLLHKMMILLAMRIVEVPAAETLENNLRIVGMPAEETPENKQQVVGGFVFPEELIARIFLQSVLQDHFNHAYFLDAVGQSQLLSESRRASQQIKRCNSDEPTTSEDNI